MKSKNIILFLLVSLIILTSLSSVAAIDSEETNLNNDNYSINEITTNYDVNNEITTIETDISEYQSESIDNSTSYKEKSNLESSALSSTTTVDGSAYNQMSNPTIQNAIDNANAGDTIIITGKEYVHCHFIVNKQLTIISTVGTTMSTCPGNTQGSGSHGIFYISPNGSGTVIQGFNLTNTYGDNDDYGILVRGAENVQIINCTINTVSDGDGIRIENAQNTIVSNCIIENSNIGINISGSNQSRIENNNISSNTVCGVNIAQDNYNTSIHTNNITYNGQYGISIFSAEYVYILNNFIAYNKNSKSSSGAGIYVNCNLTKIEILGNFLKQNGQYGVLNDYRVRNMNASKGAEQLEVNNNNYYLGHTERIAYHIEYSKYNGGPFIYNSTTDTYIYVGDGNGDYDIGKTVVYLGYAFYMDETICGTTLFKAPSTTWGTSIYKLKISPITEVKNGVYSVSIVDVNGTVASDISSIYVTFYLNKNNTATDPQDGDIYKTVLMENGTAVCDFTKESFLESGNVITACFPGLYSSYKSNPYAQFEVNDTHIPGSYSNTSISASNTKLVPKSGDYITAQLLDDDGNPVSNQNLNFKISGVSKTYARTTDENGTAKLQINLATIKTYTVSISYNGSENYNKSSKTIKLTINKQTPSINSSNVALIPKSGEYFSIQLVDGNKNAISGKEVTFTISGKSYSRTTDENGTAKLQINLEKEGKYSITIKSAKTSQYNAVSKSNTITIKAGANTVNLNTSDKTFIPKSGEYYTATLNDKNGNPLENQTIKFTISGKSYSRTTDENGTAKLQINLVSVKKYSILIKYAGDDVYSSASKSNTITIKKGSPTLNVYDRTFIAKSGQTFAAKLTDKNGNPLANETIVFAISNKAYNKTTDENGTAKLQINLASLKNYTIMTKFLGNSQYSPSNQSNSISIVNETEKSFVDENLPNEEIQRILDETPENYSVEFIGKSYDDIGLSVTKSISLYSNSNTILNGLSDSPVISVMADGVEISGFNINVNSLNKESGDASDSTDSIGILINDGKDVKIYGNTITNLLNSSLMEDYENGSTILPGHGIALNNSEAVSIIGNDISYFESGIYAEYSKDVNMESNKVTSSNYGIKYGFKNENTSIFNNTIIDNIGWYTEEVPEGPRGYGIFLNNSAVNVTINQNNISNNYIGISVDANNSTGIVITSNLIADNSLEGIRFNEGYDLAENVVEPIVTDNAIYRNAEGPSLMILGEMSANPNGIYGAGQWDDELKLKIDPNWYGVNSLRTWDNDTGIVGVGTMCPRIKTSTIYFDTIEYNNGSYTINFYKNGTQASNLATFDIYASLNRGSDIETEVHFWVVNGTGTFEFDSSNYLEGNNTIEISVGSLINVVDRIYSVVYTYEVPVSEIPV